MKKSHLDILRNISFYVSLKKESQMGLEHLEGWINDEINYNFG